MKRRFPIWRAVFGIIGVAAFAFGVLCARKWWTCRRDVADAEAAVLCEIPDACGQVGTHEVPFAVKHAFTHGLVLVVEPSGGSGSLGKAAEAMAGIKGRASIRREDQALGTGGGLLADDFWDRLAGPEDDRTLPAFGLGWRTPGPYLLCVAVEVPADKLVGVPHRLVLRYQCCGLERMIPVVAGASAIGMCMVGLVIGLCIWLVPSRSRRLAAGGVPD